MTTRTPAKAPSKRFRALLEKHGSSERARELLAAGKRERYER